MRSDQIDVSCDASHPNARGRVDSSLDNRWQHLKKKNFGITLNHKIKIVKGAAGKLRLKTWAVFYRVSTFPLQLPLSSTGSPRFHCTRPLIISCSEIVVKERKDWSDDFPYTRHHPSFGLILKDVGHYRSLCCSVVQMRPGLQHNHGGFGKYFSVRMIATAVLPTGVENIIKHDYVTKLWEFTITSLTSSWRQTTALRWSEASTQWCLYEVYPIVFIYLLTTSLHSNGIYGF